MADRTVASAAADLRLVDTKIPSDIAAAKRKLLAELRKIEAEAKIKVGVSFDAAAANRDLARFRAALKDVNIQLGVDAKAAITDLETFNAQVSEADRDDINVRVDMDGITESTAQLQLFGALADEVDADDVNVRVDVDGAAAAVAEIGAVGAAAKSVGDQERRGNGIGAALAPLAGLAAGAVAPLALAGAAIGALGVGISVFGVKASADIEQTIKAFENLLGSAEAATELFGQIQDLADISPFETQVLANATKSLLAIGVTTEDVIPTVENLAGIVSLLGGASAENFGRLTLALGQVRSSMKPMTVDLYQIQNALPGFNAKLQLAEGVAREFGITNEEAFKVIEDGGLTGAEAYDILIAQMAKFPGAATAIAAQAETLQGKLSTFTDVVKRQLVGSFLPITELIKDTLPDLTDATQEALGDIAPALSRSFEKLIPTVAPLIETLGEGLAPAFEGLFTGLGSAIEGLVPILEQLGPLLGEIFPLVGEIIGTLGPAVAGTAGAIGEALVPALEALSSVLNSIPVPVLTGLVEAIIGLTVATKVAGSVTALAQAFGAASVTMAAAAPYIVAAGLAITGLLLVLNSRGNKEAEIKAVTDEVSASLELNTAAFYENETAVTAASTAAGAATAAYKLLGTSLLNSEGALEGVAVALNNVGIAPTAQNIVDVLGQIDAFGGPDGNVANVPRIMESLTGAFGADAETVAAAISRYSDLDTIFLNLAEVSGLKLTDRQKLLIESIERLQDASEDVDMAALITGQLQASAASDPLQEKALRTAENLTGLSRATTDTAEAWALYEKQIQLAAAASEGTNIFEPLTAIVGGLPLQFAAAQEAVAEMGQVTQEEMDAAAQAVEDLQTALSDLLGMFDTDVALQNFKDSLQTLPDEFSDVVKLVEQQAQDNGVSLSDFLISGDTDAARVAFQDLVGPFITQGIGIIDDAFENQGPAAAAKLAATTRLQVIDALTRAGFDQAEAVKIAERYLPTEAWEEQANTAGTAAGDEAAKAINEVLETGIIDPVLGIDTTQARLDIHALSNEQVSVAVGADITAALNSIQSLSGRTAFINIQTSVQGDPELGRLERQLNQDLNGNGIIGRKDGGLVEFFRNGGFAGPLAREDHYAQIVPAGTWRVFAEPETGGEAYIPMGRNKRARSEKILSTVADLFGMDLVPRPSAAAVARAAHGFGDDPRAGGVGVLTREDVRTMARDIAEEVVAAMPTPVAVDHYPVGYSDPNAMAEILFAKVNAKLNRKVRRR